MKHFKILLSFHFERKQFKFIGILYMEYFQQEQGQRLVLRFDMRT